MLLQSACSKEQKNMNKVNQDIIIYTKTEKVYDHNKIASAINRGESMFDYLESLNIENYKALKNCCYTVLQTTNGLQLLMFDSDGMHGIIQPVTFSSITNKKFVENLKVGTPLKNVMEVDPDGNYDFLYHSWTAYPQISYHYFEDGNCYSIEYVNGVISNIVLFTI